MALPNLQSINPMALAQAVSPYYTSAVQANMGAADVLGQIAKMRNQRQANQQPKQKSNWMKPVGGAGAGAALGAILAAPTGGLSMGAGALLGAGAGGGLGAFSM